IVRRPQLLRRGIVALVEQQVKRPQKQGLVLLLSRLRHGFSRCLLLSPVERVSVIQAFIPPSTVRFAPVMYEDSGPATNATTAATSSTCPQRSSPVADFLCNSH